MYKRNCTIHVAKTKALISFADTAKLICVFVFAFAKCWFSNAAAHITSAVICNCELSRKHTHIARKYVQDYIMVDTENINVINAFVLLLNLFVEYFMVRIYERFAI